NEGPYETPDETSGQFVVEEPGSYTVTLVVTDDGGLTDTTSVEVEVTAPNQAPVASFVADPSSGDAPLEVSFDASGSEDPDGEIVSYEWDFGDGNSGGGVNAAHPYDEPGGDEGTLTVTDDQGATGPAGETIEVSAAPVNEPAVASLVLDPTSGEAPLTVFADASGSFDPDGEIVLYSYSMTGTTLGGDPVNEGPYETPDETSGQFVIEEPGSYTVTLV